MEIKLGNPRILTTPSGDILAELKEENGSRTFSIVLNPVSANLLNWEIEKTELQKPMIFKFVLETLTSLRANIKKIVIYDMADDVYYSCVIIKDNRENRTYKIDLHITHALSLSVASKCPIFIEEAVLAKYEERVRLIPIEKAKQAFLDLEPKKATKH